MMIMMKRHSLLAMITLAVALSAASADAADEQLVAGLPAHEALRLGEQMYREGILPSGEPMRGVVSGDVEIDGTMFSCASCHFRSGRGSLEGTVVTLPTCGSWLYKPLVGREMKPVDEARLPDWVNPPPSREAYTDALVARAIWAGKDPNGRELNSVMPRYKLSTQDMKILVYYLKNLSAEFSPGVDDTTIRFATVVSHNVSAENREAMLLPLQAHIRDHNSQVRHNERRAQNGPWNMAELYSPYRRFALAVWEVQGDPSTWSAQLEEYYREAPVFALLGGIAKDWTPVHEFCERHEIPELLPITDYPVVSDSEWYTVYFSKGFYQEGEAAARFLRRSEAVANDAPVVQVLRPSHAVRDVVAGFVAAREAMGLAAPTEIVLAPEQKVDQAFWSKLVADNPGAVLALWLEPADLVDLGALAAVESRPPMVLVSGGLLGEVVTDVPAKARPFTYITYPHSLPEDVGRAKLAVEGWLKVKGIPVTNFDIEARVHFLGWMLSGIIKRMRDDFYRDYFLDVVDMMRDEYYSISSVYPRLSFGPGQRYASKGCYVVQLDDSDPPQLVKRSGWVIH